MVSHDDPHNKTIFSLLPRRYKNYYYIGRLDKNSRGLLLLTDVPSMVDAYENPIHNISKMYIVTIDKRFRSGDAAQMRTGIFVDQKGKRHT